MSEGPIKRWRDSYKPERVSTPTTRAVHGMSGWRAYCGRKSTALAINWADVTCADCIAAKEADRG